jgi:hypothetical protein
MALGLTELYLELSNYISALLSVLVYFSGHSVRYINRDMGLCGSIAQQICNKLAAPYVTYTIVTDLKGY